MIYIFPHVATKSSCARSSCLHLQGRRSEGEGGGEREIAKGWENHHVGDGKSRRVAEV